MPLLRQFVWFSIVGAVGTTAHFAVFVALVAAAGVSPLIATTAGAIVGATINYALNYRITFASRVGHALALRKFIAVAAAGVLVNGAVVGFGTSVLGAHYLLAQVVATSVVLVLGYAANRAWTFREVGCASK
jgi:putative flippase GtrA